MGSRGAVLRGPPGRSLQQDVGARRLTTTCPQGNVRGGPGLGCSSQLTLQFPSDATDGIVSEEEGSATGRAGTDKELSTSFARADYVISTGFIRADHMISTGFARADDMIQGAFSPPSLPRATVLLAPGCLSSTRQPSTGHSPAPCPLLTRSPFAACSWPVPATTKKHSRGRPKTSPG